MKSETFEPTIADGIAALRTRWPRLESKCEESPVFVLAAGPGSGSTLLQQLLSPHCFLWGEPYGQSGLIENLAASLRVFAASGLVTADVRREAPQSSALHFIVDRSPDPKHLLNAHGQFFEAAFARPARAEGADRWGLITRTLSADHAAYLKWLFPKAKLLFLYRNPFDAFRSCAARQDADGELHHARPYQAIAARGFGAHWRKVVRSFLAERERLGALVVRYENLAAGRFEELEQYLGLRLDREVAHGKLGDDAPRPLASIADHERVALLHEVGPLAERLGFQAAGHCEATPQPEAAAAGPPDPSKCVVLVPVGAHIEPECDDALRQLESRGYTVRRVRGYAAIDQGRNQMATDALADGFEELLWVDSDIAFHPDDIDRLRAHGLPIVCGIYPKKGMRAVSCHVLPGTTKLVFGEGGGLVEVLYAATGFLLVRRQVFFDVQRQLSLPLCNEKFGRPMLPFFLPLLHPEPSGHWYLAEDYAFSQRARECGYQIWADTTIRLKHIGSYGFSWEDAGLQLQRFGSFHLNLSSSEETERQPQTEVSDASACNPLAAFDECPQLGELALLHPWPEERPNVLPNPHGWLHSSTKELLASVLDDQTRLVVELGAWLGQSTRFIADHAPGAVVLAVDHWRGSPEHQAHPELQRLLPTLYETFLTNCWAYRRQVLPMRITVAEALEEIGGRGLKPDVIYLDADHGYEAVKADLSRIRNLFPDAIVVGDDWDWESVRSAAVDVARQQGGVVGVHGSAWRFFGKPPSSPAPQSLLQQTIVSLDGAGS